MVVRAKRKGILKNVEALGIGELSVKIGCNKINKDDVINYGAGIKLLKNIGDEIEIGDELALLYVSNKVKLTESDFDCFEIE